MKSSLQHFKIILWFIWNNFNRASIFYFLHRLTWLSEEHRMKNFILKAAHFNFLIECAISKNRRMHYKMITPDFGSLISRISTSPRLSARRLDEGHKTCRQTPNFILKNSPCRLANQKRCFTSNTSLRFKKHSNLIETNK